jgi:hypothetical protein
LIWRRCGATSLEDNSWLERRLLRERPLTLDVIQRAEELQRLLSNPAAVIPLGANTQMGPNSRVSASTNRPLQPNIAKTQPG